MSVLCEGCGAKCCKNYDVFIDHHDLDILEDLSFIKKIKYERSFGYVPKFILWENGHKLKWVLCLNNPDRVCQFLIDDKCSIYEKRPLICRTYPHFIDGDKVKTMKNLCPAKWILTSDQELELKINYRNLLVNFLALETICDQWNKVVTKEDRLENFLIFVDSYRFI